MPGSRATPAQRKEFDREASGYDRNASASMPAYTDLHRTLLGGIPYVPTRAFNVLELGVGTGTLSALLLSQFPHARVTGIDLSPRMIALARRKLKAFGHRVELVAGPLEEFEERPYDVVVSALAIHHLSDAEKWRLFRRVYRILPRGGYWGTRTTTFPRTRSSTSAMPRSPPRCPDRHEAGRGGSTSRRCGTNTSGSTTPARSRPRPRRWTAPGLPTWESRGASSGKRWSGLTNNSPGSDTPAGELRCCARRPSS